MKYLVFCRESNKFDDILNDASITKKYRTKLQYKNHMILGFPCSDEKFNSIISYVMLKYGDDMVDFRNLVPDRSPIIGKDYVPEKVKSLR